MVLIIMKMLYLTFAFLPLESDKVLLKGMETIEKGSFIIQFSLPKQGNGIFLNIEGLPSFRVYLNGKYINTFENQKRVTLVLNEIESLMQGTNLLEIKSHLEKQSFFYSIWQSEFNWYYGTFHSHTRYSDGIHSVSALLNLVNSEGGNFCAITDHDTLGQCYDTAFHRTGICEPIRGTEWTTDSGHANILGMDGAITFHHETILRMIDDATYRGGLVQINHPCDDELGMGWDHYPLLDPGIDAIEIFNNFTWFPEEKRRSDNEAVAWWHQLLCQGKRIAAVGNSDYHGNVPGENPLKAHSAVFARSDHPDTILKALKLGRVMICDEMRDSRLYIYADTNNNNIMDLIMGENITIKSGSKTIKFRLEVDDADALDRVLVYSKEGLVHSHTITFGGDYEYEWQRTFTNSDTNFMRVELITFSGDYEYCTNPIYINYPDYELGPVDLINRTLLPETTCVGTSTDLSLWLKNSGLVSPYRFGLRAAVDTTEFDIIAWQQTGPGIGEVIHIPNLTGYEIIEWKGGYPYSVRLSPRDSFNYWMIVKPKRQGYSNIFYRSWADDRLFIIEKEPVTGWHGPDGEDWNVDSMYVKPSTYIAESSDESINTLSIKCQPNPAKERLLIILPEILRKNSSFTLKIFDVKGSLIKEFIPMAEYVWDLNGVKNGVYFLVLKTEDKKLVRKIIVLQ